jgi:hypothetical protein
MFARPRAVSGVMSCGTAGAGPAACRVAPTAAPVAAVIAAANGGGRRSLTRTGGSPRSLTGYLPRTAGAAEVRARRRAHAHRFRDSARRRSRTCVPTVSAIVSGGEDDAGLTRPSLSATLRPVARSRPPDSAAVRTARQGAAKALVEVLRARDPAHHWIITFEGRELANSGQPSPASSGHWPDAGEPKGRKTAIPWRSASSTSSPDKGTNSAPG